VAINITPIVAGESPAETKRRINMVGAVFVAAKWTLAWLVAGGGHTLLGCLFGAVKYFGWAVLVA
jgi:hypothetical protein